MRSKIKIFDGLWSVKDVKANPDKIFIYGDNDLRTGKGGQAIIRGLSNTMGIRTKKKPTYDKDAFYTDLELESNKKKIFEDINSIKLELLFGKTIFLSRGGYGTDRAKLQEKAPLTFDYLNKMLLDNFYYDNTTGKHYVRIPSHAEMMAAPEVPMNYEHDKIGFGQEVPGLFRKELLDAGITNTFDAIKAGMRCATTRADLFKAGQIVRMTNSKTDEILVCKVTTNSYPVTSISKEMWSKLEGWDDNYFTLNPNALDKFQFQFEFICSVGKLGKMVFREGIL